jgi:hypothetical protein
MKLFTVVLCCLGLFICGCSLSASTEATSESEAVVQPVVEPTAIQCRFQTVDVRTIVVKMVERPSDRERDFTVIPLDGTYTLCFDLNSCTVDSTSYAYGPYDSVKHCSISEPNITDRLISDQAWLDDDLEPFKRFISCMNGWVYLGTNAQGEEVWFIEMFGFAWICR